MKNIIKLAIAAVRRGVYDRRSPRQRRHHDVQRADRLIPDLGQLDDDVEAADQAAAQDGQAVRETRQDDEQEQAE